MEGFAIRFTTERSLEDVRERLREALAKRGFGVLWELDVTETLAKKGRLAAIGRDVEEELVAALREATQDA